MRPMSHCFSGGAVARSFDATRRREATTPTSRPKVAEEKTRSESPFNSRSQSTMTRPNAAPARAPWGWEPNTSSPIISPMHAVNVTKSARRRVMVSLGVIGTLLQRRNGACATEYLPDQRPRFFSGAGVGAWGRSL